MEGVFFIFSPCSPSSPMQYDQYWSQISHLKSGTLSHQGTKTISQNAKLLGSDWHSHPTYIYLPPRLSYTCTRAPVHLRAHISQLSAPKEPFLRSFEREWHARGQPILRIRLCRGFLFLMCPFQHHLPTKC